MIVRKYGVSEVEQLLDSCHALMNYGVDRYKRPERKSPSQKKPLAKKNVRLICNLKSTNCGAQCHKTATKRKSRRYVSQVSHREHSLLH
ncbi:SpoVR family protein [Vibrio chagasii]|nr:SpoVR family protein [Vibrio chagasii]